MFNHLHADITPLEAGAARGLYPIFNPGRYPGKTGEIPTNENNSLIRRSGAEFYTYVLTPP
jgi:hypothetical protein